MGFPTPSNTRYVGICLEDPVTELINSSLLMMGEFVVGSLFLRKSVVEKLRGQRAFPEVLRIATAVRIMVKKQDIGSRAPGYSII